MLTACLQRVKSLFSLVPSSVLLLISVSFWGSLSVPPPFSRTKRHYLECPNKVLDKLLSVGMSVISEYTHTYTSFSSLSLDVIMIFTATFVLSFHPLRRLNKKRKKREKSYSNHQQFYIHVSNSFPIQCSVFRISRTIKPNYRGLAASVPQNRFDEAPSS